MIQSSWKSGGNPGVLNEDPKRAGWNIAANRKSWNTGKHFVGLTKYMMKLFQAHQREFQESKCIFNNDCW